MASSGSEEDSEVSVRGEEGRDVDGGVEVADAGEQGRIVGASSSSERSIRLRLSLMGFAGGRSGIALVLEAVEAYLLTTLVGGVSSGSVSPAEDGLSTSVERGVALVVTLPLVAGTVAASSIKRERLTLDSSGTEALPFKAELAKAWFALAKGLVIAELDFTIEVLPIPV